MSQRSGGAEMFGPHPEQYLLNAERERRVVRARRHWAVLLKVLLQTVGILITLVVLSRLVSAVVHDLRLTQSILWYAAAATVMRFAWNVLDWWEELFIVTDKRLMRGAGIIQRKSWMMPITKVANVSVLRPPLGQLFNYGTLIVESSSWKQDLTTIKIEYLNRPEEVFEIVAELVFGEKGVSPHLDQGTGGRAY